MSGPDDSTCDREFVREQIHELTKTLTRVMFGDFECVARTTRPDDDFGYLASMINVAINAARNAQRDLAKSYEKQRQEHLLLEDVLTSIEHGVFCKDRDGRVVMINATGANIWGRTVEQVLGKTVHDLMPADVAAAVRAEEEQIMATGETVVSEWTMELQGEVRSLQSVKSPQRDEAGNIQGIFGVCRDITERVESEKQRAALEEQLRHSQKLEAIGQLAGGIAHDFNNLLTLIMGCAHSLRDAVGRSERGTVDEIAQAAERAATLTEQLLAFGRKSDSDPQPIELGAALAEIEAILIRVLGENIELSTRSCDEAAWVYLDPGHMEQVILNLVVNARDAMPDGGRIEIRVEVEHIDASASSPTLAPGDYAVLVVRDTGIGIPAAVLPRVFEPFFTTKEVGQGSGLGLSTVYGIARQCLGDVTVTSEAGVGTEFRVLLPRVEAPTRRPQPAVPPVVQCGHERILVVEDNPNVRALVERILRRHGYDVTSVDGGAAALDALAEQGQPIELVVSDVVMPGMSGVDLAQRLARQHPRVPILLVSGYSRDELDIPGMTRDRFTLLRKPFTPPELLRAVRRLLSRAATSEPALPGRREGPEAHGNTTNG